MVCSIKLACICKLGIFQHFLGLFCEMPLQLNNFEVIKLLRMLNTKQTCFQYKHYSLFRNLLNFQSSHYVLNKIANAAKIFLNRAFTYWFSLLTQITDFSYSIIADKVNR